MDDTQHDGHNDGPMQPGTPAISQEMADLLARVPYFAQTSPLNCGPTCLRMIAATCGPDPGIAAMEEASGIEKGKAVSTLDLVTAMGRVLAPQAADVVFCSLSPVFNEANMTHAFYQLHYDGSVEASEQQLAEVEAQGIQVFTRSVPLSELQDWLAASTPAAPQLLLCLLDWSRVRAAPAGAGDVREGGYCGHFVVVVGMDGPRVLYHNPCPSSGHGGGRGCSVMDVAVFEEARLADGTDEDVVFIRCHRDTQ